MHLTLRTRDIPVPSPHGFWPQADKYAVQHPYQRINGKNVAQRDATHQRVNTSRSTLAAAFGGGRLLPRTEDSADGDRDGYVLLTMLRLPSTDTDLRRTAALLPSPLRLVSITQCRAE